MNRPDDVRQLSKLTFGLTLCMLLVAADAPKKGAPAAAGDDDVDYVPPASGAPGGRKGGIARGCKEDPSLYVSMLAPRSAGRTSQSQPVLFWYLSKPTRHEIDIALTPIDDLASPALRLKLANGVDKAGIQKLDLSRQHGPDGKKVMLKAGKTYDWVIEIVMHQSGGSNNPNATTFVQRADLTKAQSDQLDKLPASRRAAFFANAGYWYDLLDELHQRISKDDDAAARQAWVRLLEKQGLKQSPDGTIEEAAAPSNP